MNDVQFNLLLADDDADDCMFFKEALDELEIETKLETVHNGEQLISFLMSELTALPDILFLDLNMPRKTGFDCLLEIKQNEKLKNIPVIIYSTSLDSEVVNLLYENGAQYYIRKPGDFTLLKDIIFKSLTVTLQNQYQRPAKEDFILTL